MFPILSYSKWNKFFNDMLVLLIHVRSIPELLRKYSYSILNLLHGVEDQIFSETSSDDLYSSRTTFNHPDWHHSGRYAKPVDTSAIDGGIKRVPGTLVAFRITIPIRSWLKEEW